MIEFYGDFWYSGGMITQEIAAFLAKFS